MNFIKNCVRSIFRFFVPKSLSIEEKLENITKILKNYEDQKRQNLSTERKIIGAFILYSLIVYFGIAAVLVLYFRPSEGRHYLLFLAPIVLLPFIIYYIKKFIHWFYIRRIVRVDNQIKELTKQKNQLLSQVAEKETYKKASEILNRYDVNFEFRKSMDNLFIGKTKISPEIKTKSDLIRESNERSKSFMISSMRAESACDLRQRKTTINASPSNLDEIPMNLMQKNDLQKSSSQLSRPSEKTNEPKRLPRPLLNQNRSNFDKLVDFLVGDGFNQRYALICTTCSCHNGMALQEEFLYISFVCAYCGVFNKARKVKPDPPGINEFPQRAIEQIKINTTINKDEVKEIKKLQTSPESDEALVEHINESEHNKSD